MRLAPLGLLLFSCAVYDRSLLGDGGTSGEGGPCSGTKMLCGKTCVDTATDLKNCGACGHDCLEGKCVNGACTGVLLASALPAPKGIVLDATRAYFSNQGSITTQVVGKDGAGLANFGGAQVFPDVLVISGSSIYWNNESNIRGVILSMQLTDIPSDVPTKIAVDLPAPTGVAVVNNDVFFTTGPVNMSGNGCSISSYVSALLRCPTTGCVVQNCSAGGPTTLAAGLKDPRGLVADVAAIYWADTTMGDIFTCPTPNCGTGPKAIATGQSGPLDVRIDAANVYWTSSTSGDVMTCTRASCTPRKLASGQMSPRRLALDNTSPPQAIWWTNGDGTVMRCDLPNCASPVQVAKNIPSPWGIAVDDTNVFVVNEGTQGTNSMDGTVIRFPR